MISEKERIARRDIFRANRRKKINFIKNNGNSSINSLMSMTGQSYVFVFNVLMDMKIDTMKQIVKKELGERYIPKVQVRYNLDKEGILGTANTRTNMITLGINLIKEYGKYYIKHTFAHEYAHLVLELMYPNYKNKGITIGDHGEEFRSVCRLFGINGDASTDLDYLSTFSLEDKFLPTS